MAIERRPRLKDGSLGSLEKIGEGLTDKEKVVLLEEENALLVYDSLMKDIRIETLEETQAEIIFGLMNGGIL